MGSEAAAAPSPGHTAGAGDRTVTSSLSVAQILTIWFSRNLLGEMYWDMTVPKGPVGFGVGQAVFLRVVQMSRLLCNYGQD